MNLIVVLLHKLIKNQEIYFKEFIPIKLQLLFIFILPELLLDFSLNSFSQISFYPKSFCTSSKPLS